MVFDLVVSGGLVVDGTGRTAAHTADVGVTAGRIAAIAAPGSLEGAERLDAAGRIVTPGFIDIHTHYDAQVLWDPMLSPSNHQGVTTVIGGNCGFTLAPCLPEHRGIVVDTLESVEDMAAATLHAGIRWDFTTFDDYLAVLERAPLGANYASYVGHTALRLFVMGDEAHDRPATPAEVDRMAGLAREALGAGAIGISTDRSRFHRGAGGRRVPSAVAAPDEIEALMRVCAAGGGVFETNPDDEFAWLYDASARTGCTVTWTALVTYPEHTTGRTPWREKRRVHREGWARGVRVHPQVTCRPLTVQLSLVNPTPFVGAPSFQDLMTLPPERRVERYRDPVWRVAARDELASGRWHRVRWDAVSVAETTVDPAVVGRTLAELGEAEGRDPFDVLVDLALAEDLRTRCTMIVGNDDPHAVGELLREEGCLLGISDAGAHVGMLCDAGMPVELVAWWSRDRSVLSLEEAVHRLTGEPASVFGFGDRGVLAPGHAADLLVLDLERLAPSPLRRVFDLPAGGDRLVADQVTGIEHVVVNGVRRGGTPAASDDGRAGRVLRPFAR